MLTQGTNRPKEVEIGEHKPFDMTKHFSLKLPVPPHGHSLASTSLLEAGLLDDLCDPDGIHKWNDSTEGSIGAREFNADELQ